MSEGATLADYAARTDEEASYIEALDDEVFGEKGSTL